MKTISTHDGKNLDVVVTDLEKKLDKASIDEVISDYLDEHPIQEYDPRLPQVTQGDNGDFLRVVNGEWQDDTVPIAESNVFGGGS